MSDVLTAPPAYHPVEGPTFDDLDLMHPVDRAIEALPYKYDPEVGLPDGLVFDNGMRPYLLRDTTRSDAVSARNTERQELAWGLMANCQPGESITSEQLTRRVDAVLPELEPEIGPSSPPFREVWKVYGAEGRMEVLYAEDLDRLIELWRPGRLHHPDGTRIPDEEREAALARYNEAWERARLRVLEGEHGLVPHAVHLWRLRNGFITEELPANWPMIVAAADQVGMTRAEARRQIMLRRPTSRDGWETAEQDLLLYGNLLTPEVVADLLPRPAPGTRRARAIASGQSGISALTVAERDEWTCGICGGEIPQMVWDAGIYQPLYRSVDHIMPIQLGGTHTWENVQAAHLACNIAKRAKHPGAIAAEVAATFLRHEV